jgi:cytochrome c553
VADPDDLAGIPLFDSLSEADIEQLASWFAVKTVSEGVRLANEGASGYFVLRPGGRRRGRDIGRRNRRNL